MAAPKDRYIDFLPAVYRRHAGPGSPEFLEAYLHVFQTILGRTPPRGDETPEHPTAVDRKGLASVIDVLPDLFYPRLSFLFEDDTEDFIPKFAPPRPPRGYTDHKLAELNSYFGITDPMTNDAWQAAVTRWLGEFLDWQAAWLGFQPDDNWTIDNKRLQLALILPIFRQRGTARGLEQLLRMFVDPAIEVHDMVDALALTVGETTRLSEEFDQTEAVVGGLRPYSFVVQLTVGPNETDLPQTTQKIAAIEALTDREKPANTSYRIVVKEAPEQQQ